MPTKQEIIDMMENHLPGEPVSIGPAAVETRQPPAYPTLDRTLNGDQMQQGEYDARVYSITGPAALPISHPPAQFGSRSHLTFCPHCRSPHMTRVDYQSTMMTHIIAAILCCTTFISSPPSDGKLRNLFERSCSCCLPYLFDNCKTARHYCPQCNTYLGAQVK